MNRGHPTEELRCRTQQPLTELKKVLLSSVDYRELNARSLKNQTHDFFVISLSLLPYGGFLAAHLPVHSCISSWDSSYLKETSRETRASAGFLVQHCYRSTT